MQDMPFIPQFTFFPKLDFPPSFEFAKAQKWARAIKDRRLGTLVQRRLAALRDSSGIQSSAG